MKIDVELLMPIAQYALLAWKLVHESVRVYIEYFELCVLYLKTFVLFLNL